MIAVLAFIRSPVGRYLIIGLAVLGLLCAIYGKGRADEHTAMQKRVDLVQASLNTCHANGNALQASINGHNKAVEAMQQVSDKKIAEAAKALSVASKGRAGAEAKAAKLLAQPPAGIDACARMTSADEKVLEALK